MENPFDLCGVFPAFALKEAGKRRPENSYFLHSLTEKKIANRRADSLELL